MLRLPNTLSSLLARTSSSQTALRSEAKGLVAYRKFLGIKVRDNKATAEINSSRSSFERAMPTSAPATFTVQRPLMRQPSSRISDLRSFLATQTDLVQNNRAKTATPAHRSRFIEQLDENKSSRTSTKALHRSRFVEQLEDSHASSASATPYFTAPTTPYYTAPVTPALQRPASTPEEKLWLLADNAFNVSK